MGICLRLRILVCAGTGGDAEHVVPNALDIGWGMGHDPMARTRGAVQFEIDVLGPMMDRTGECFELVAR